MAGTLPPRLPPIVPLIIAFPPMLLLIPPTAATLPLIPMPPFVALVVEVAVPVTALLSDALAVAVARLRVAA